MTDSLNPGSQKGEDLLELDVALQALAKFDLRKSRVVELKFFGGLTTDEIAEVLKISRITVRRDWEFAKVWLYTELRGDA